ncbi:hypothetical protein MFRU_021g01350 [Monilinia fructicola]|nr:hypothetical protein MFRU_021g01350 [Monilinia fructicola]
MCVLIETFEVCPTCGDPKRITNTDFYCEYNIRLVVGNIDHATLCGGCRELRSTIVADSQCKCCNRKKMTSSSRESDPCSGDELQELTETIQELKKLADAIEEISEDDRDSNDDNDSDISEVSALSDEAQETMSLEFLEAELEYEYLLYFSNEDYTLVRSPSAPTLRTRVQELRREAMGSRWQN